MQLADDGFIVVGYKDSFGSGGTDVYLIRTDRIGNTVWTRTFGGPGDDFGWDVLPADDGGFIVTGFTNSEGAGGDDILLLRTNGEGELLWQRTFGGAAGERAWAMAPFGEGFVIAGQTKSYGNGDWDIYLIHVSQDGDTLWTTTAGGKDVDRVFFVTTTEDGQAVFAGMSSSFRPLRVDV